MSDLLEVVFEGVPSAEVGRLLARLAGPETNVVRVDAVPGLEASDDPPLRRVERWIASEVEGWAVLALETLAIGSYTVAQAMVRVLRYDTYWDVEVNFDLADVTIPDGEAFVQALQAFARDLAGAHGVTDFFAGLEPAADEDTRLFTGTQLGPLSPANLGR